MPLEAEQSVSLQPPDLAADWPRFRISPVGCVSEARIAACFDQNINSGATLLLVKQARFTRRLKQLMVEKFELAELPVQPPEPAIDAAIAMMSARNFERLVRISGMIANGSVFAGEIRSAVVRARKAAFGEADVAIAVENCDLSFRSESVDEPGALMKQVIADGFSCAAVWMGQQSAPVWAWCRLKLAEDITETTPADGNRVDLACAIVRRAAGCLMRRDNTGEAQ